MFRNRYRTTEIGQRLDYVDSLLSIIIGAKSSSLRIVLMIHNRFEKTDKGQMHNFLDTLLCINLKAKASV